MNVENFIQIIITIASFGIIFIPLLIWILSQVIKIGKLEERLDNLEKSINSLENTIKNQFLPLYYKMKFEKNKSNPVSQEEEKKLLKKFQDGTLTKEEAEKLKLILEEEKEEAEKSGNIVEAIVIGLLLAFLIYLIYKLSQEK